MLHKNVPAHNKICFNKISFNNNKKIRSEFSFSIPGTIFERSLADDLLHELLLVGKDVVSEDDLGGGVADVHPLGMKAFEVLNGKAALGGEDPGHEEVLDGDERSQQRHLQQTLGKRLREDVAAEIQSFIKEPLIKFFLSDA